MTFPFSIQAKAHLITTSGNQTSTILTNPVDRDRTRPRTNLWHSSRGLCSRTRTAFRSFPGCPPRRSGSRKSLPRREKRVGYHWFREHHPTQRGAVLNRKILPSRPSPFPIFRRPLRSPPPHRDRGSSSKQPLSSPRACRFSVDRSPWRDPCLRNGQAGSHAALQALWNGISTFRNAIRSRDLSAHARAHHQDRPAK